MKRKLITVAGLMVVMSLLGGCGQSGSDTDVASAMPAEIARGMELYTSNCKVCHAQSINGAPIIGNKKMWEPRIGKGIDALVANAVNGVGLMPAKGGRTELSEADIRLIVQYYLYELQ